MARPSKLSPEQWVEVAGRHAAGEGARALAREFGVDEAAIRRRVSPQTPQVRSVARQVAAAQDVLAALPVAQQYTALSLAEKLRGISDSLATAASNGARTAAQMTAIASQQAAKVARAMDAAGDEADPMDHQDKLQAISALTKIGNDAAALGMGLLAANKDALKVGVGCAAEEKPGSSVDVAGLSAEQLKALASIKIAE